MKTILLLFLITISLIASEEQSTGEDVKKTNKTEVPKYIVDPNTFRLVDSKKAFYIIGSKKYGTMKENFAFATKEDAEKYVKKNGGSVVDYNTYISIDKNSSK